ncbi:MAG TPA: glycosyltransferase family 4 protein [Planktothrix sp.]
MAGQVTHESQHDSRCLAKHPAAVETVFSGLVCKRLICQLFQAFSQQNLYADKRIIGINAQLEMKSPATEQHQEKPTAQKKRRLRLALVSCGLGNVHRGFEVSTLRWYDALKQHPDLDVRLFRGGKHPEGHLVWNIPRDWVLNSPLAIFRPINRRRYWEFCYGVEMVSFGLFFWPDLFKFRPDIIWTKEVPFGYFLPFYRAALCLRSKIIFANGGAFRPSTYKDFDYIQHLTQESYEEALEFGISPEKMEVLTNTITFHEPSTSREQIRTELGYAEKDWVIICVSAWNAYHKRIDYLIDEIASIDDPSVKLLLCGHPDAETGVLKQRAEQKLGNRVQWKTVSDEKVHAYMKASDTLVLASTEECLGNCVAEAVMAGLPVITHSHTASRYILGTSQCEWMVDLTQSGAVRQRVLELRGDKGARDRVKLAQPRVTECFSAQSLVPKFYDMAVRLRG